MLPWYTELTLFQHTAHLSLLHNVCQILNPILKKCLKASCCGISATQIYFFRRNQFKPYNQIFFKSIRYTGCLKKSKPKGTAHLLPKVFLIILCWIETALAVPSAFFAPSYLHRPFLRRPFYCTFKPLPDCVP